VIHRLLRKSDYVSTSTPHERAPVAPLPLQRPRSRPFGWSTGTWIVNGVLVVVLLGLGVYAYTTLGSSGGSSVPTRLATVQRGVVLTTVSASGSVASAGDVAANFQTSGTLTVVRVKAGQRVAKGEVLARVDSLAARQAVAEAGANLATAQGRLQQTLNPMNTQEKAQLTVSDEQAAQSVRTATISLSDTNAQAAHDLGQAQSAVTAAKRQLAGDQAQRTKDVKAKATQAVIDQDDSKVSADQIALQSANANVSTTRLKNTQSVHSAQNQLAQAKLQQQSNAAANAVKTAAPKPGDLAAAKAAVVQAQIQLAQARKALRETTLRAPVAGVVASVDGSVGDTVTASGNGSSSNANSSAAATGDSSSSSSSFVTITAENRLQVVAGFSEGDAASINVGQPATATISALPGVAMAAKVIAIDSTATTVSNVVTYNVTFALAGTNSKLKPGMTADVEVVTAVRAGALHVPTTAVTGSGANARVTVMRDGKQVTTAVVAGLKGDDATEIKSGLRAGDTVVLPTLNIAGLGSSSSSQTGGPAGRFRAATFGGGGFGGP
jgi:multidrug efflux pump subunit AcrA (membrane-fusion protein)